MNLTIRPANLKDFPIILRLHQELYLDNQQYDPHLDMNRPHSKQGKNDLKKRLKDPTNCCLLAMVDNQPVGYLIGRQTKLCFKTIPMGEISDMLITEKHRSQNIGTKLIERFKIWCKDNGLTRIVTDVYYSNQKAINFYQKHNLKPTALILEGDI